MADNNDVRKERTRQRGSSADIGWRRFTRVSVVVSFILAVIGVYAGSGALGIQLPRPATISEHNADVRAMSESVVKLAGGVKENKIAVLEHKVEWLERQVWATEDLIEKRGRTAERATRLREQQSQLNDARAKLVRVRGW